MSDVTAQPTPDYPPAPEGLGLVWDDRGITKNSRGPYRDSVARTTPSFNAAWDNYGFRDQLRSWGYSGGGTWVQHYGRGERVDPEAMMRIEARAQADVARVSAESEPARQGLVEALTEIGWAMSPPTVREIREMVERGISTVNGLHRARELLERTQASIAKARESLGEQVAAVQVDVRVRCEDPQVQGDVHAGCRYLSDRDGDLATVQNGEGWSQSTSRMGHLVAQRETLDAAHAAVGLGLLHGHRRQLPDDLRVRLFGVEKPKRRKAPSPPLTCWPEAAEGHMGRLVTEPILRTTTPVVNQCRGESLRSAQGRESLHLPRPRRCGAVQ